MERIIRIYDEILKQWINLDIDDDTAIGIDIQCFDPKEPLKRKFKTSNEFTLPNTALNKRIFDYTSDPQKMIYDKGSISSKLYFKTYCEYRIDNELIIFGLIQVNKMSNDRISCYISPDTTMWDVLKSISWAEFEDIYLQYLCEEHNEYYYNSDEDKHVYYMPNLWTEELMQQYFMFFCKKYGKDNTSKLKIIPQFTDIDVSTRDTEEKYYYPEFVQENIGNPLFLYKTDDVDDRYREWEYGYRGGKFSTRFVDILGFIEYYFEKYQNYPIKFKYDENDKYLNNLGVRLPNVYARFGIDEVDSRYFFYISTSNNNSYLGLSSPDVKFRSIDDGVVNNSLSLLDYLTSVCQSLNLVIYDENDDKDIFRNIELRPMINEEVDEFHSLTDDLYTDEYDFTPKIENYKYLNWIGYENCYEQSPSKILNNNLTWIGGIRDQYWNTNSIMSSNRNLDQGYDTQSQTLDYGSLYHPYKIKGFVPFTYETWTHIRDVQKYMAFWRTDALDQFNHFLFGSHVNGVYDDTNTGVTTFCAIKCRPFTTNIEYYYYTCYSKDVELSQITSLMCYQSNDFRKLVLDDLYKLIHIPQVWKVKKYIKPGELDNYFRVNKVFNVKHLNGKFMITKISGYNPLKSTEPVEIEMVKITEI